MLGSMYPFPEKAQGSQCLIMTVDLYVQQRENQVLQDREQRLRDRERAVREAEQLNETTDLVIDKLIDQEVSKRCQEIAQVWRTC